MQDLKDIGFIFLGVVFAILGSAVVAIWTLAIILLQIIAHYFHWILICATALTLGYWYL